MKRLSLLVVCALATPAAAETNMADSIEWQTVDSDVVVRGFVTGVTEKAVHKVMIYEVTLQITESLKGGKKQTLTFGSFSSPHEWKKNKTDLLVFLVDGKAIEDADLQKFALVPRRVRGSGDSIYELGKTTGYTSTFAVVTKATEVLAAVRTAARSTATTAHRVDVPWDTDAMKALYGGSTVWMNLPVDANLEKLALTWIVAKDLSTREEGALALGEFRSAANIARLKALLADRDFAQSSNGNGPVTKLYLVRKAAHEALTKWHVTHDTPIVEEREK